MFQKLSLLSTALQTYHPIDARYIMENAEASGVTFKEPSHMGKDTRMTDDVVPSVSEQLVATVELLKEKRMLLGQFA